MDTALLRHNLLGLALNENGSANYSRSLHPTKYPWVHEQWFKTFDHQA